MSADFLHNNKALIDDESRDQHKDIAANPYNKVEVITDIDDFFALRNHWNQIHEDSPKGTVFNSWDWMYTWWETYQKQGKRSLYILICTDTHNEALAIAPFQIVNNPKRYFPCSKQILMLGTGETDGSLVFGEYADLVIRQGHEDAAISAFSDFLSQQQNLWDGMKFQQLLKDSYLSSLFDTPSATDLVKQEESDSNTSTEGITNLKQKFNGAPLLKTVVNDGFRTYIDLPESYKDYLMSLRKKMRNNITRTYSRLESEQSFTITSVSTDSEVKALIEGKDDALEILAKLNRTRQSSLENNSVFETPNFVLFHKRILKRLMPNNKVSLRILRFGHEPVAALYSFIDRGTLHVYQSGFETVTGQRYSLLTTMLTQEIAKSIENEEVDCFNFMYSTDESTYKRRYSGTTEKMYNISYDKKNLKYKLYRCIHITLKNYIKKKLNK